jgi:hypothetical protein
MQEDFVIICAWCRKILQQPLPYTYNEQAIHRRSHGICEECFISMRYEISQIQNQHNQTSSKI